MFDIRTLFAALVCGALILAPTLADARAGGGKSMGSRGANTFQQTPAKPIDRSVTQNRPGQTAPAAVAPGSAMGGRSPFMSGLMGGLLGAGLVGLLFGSGAFAAEGAAGMMGMMLQFALIAAAAWIGLMLFRRLMGGAPAVATAGTGRAPFTPALPAAGAAMIAAPDKDIADADRQEFGALLTDIQQAWGDGDLNKLRRLVTPEMLSYFSEDLADAASRGVRNVVANVELVKGDVVDHWVEGERHYATAVMTWRAIDYVERDGAVIGGDDKNPTEATEAWTFMRIAGGKWLLSAIQQV